MISPCWSYCLSYELELRKDAIRLCKEQSFGIQSALWTALRNTEHRNEALVAPRGYPEQLLVLKRSRTSILQETDCRLGESTFAFPAAKCPETTGTSPAVRRWWLFQRRLHLHKVRKEVSEGREAMQDVSGKSVSNSWYQELRFLL